MRAKHCFPYFLPCLTTGLAAIAVVALVGASPGCDALVVERRAPLFTTPLSIDGLSVGDAIIDTGGAYEIILRESLGLELIDTVEVLAFGGRELVAVTKPFAYTAGGVPAVADFALVGLSVCECNGIGFHFFRKTGTVLGLDYSTMQAEFLTTIPRGGVTLAFADPPPGLGDFDSAFIEVDVASPGYDVFARVLALLDTGTNATVMRRGLFASGPDPLAQDRLEVTIHRQELGAVAARVRLFDTPGLPDLILGTDVMGAWSDRWYFRFAQRGGTVTAYPRIEEPTLSTPSERVPAARRTGPVRAAPVRKRPGNAEIQAAGASPWTP